MGVLANYLWRERTVYHDLYLGGKALVERENVEFLKIYGRKFQFPEASFAVHVFSLEDLPIACLNKAMAFLTVVASLRFPSTYNQLRTSSNPRYQATIQDGRVDATSYGEQCKADRQGLLMLDNCQDLGLRDSQAVQIIIPNNVAFQTEDLNTYDSDCNDISNAQAVLMEKLALKEQVDSLEKNLSKQIKEKELGQSAQTVHMLTKPQAFYNNIHKQALGYQNLSHLKKAQRIKPTLYDGIVISDKHVAMPMIDDEETLILEEKS
ncbi:hypothetical protein Tco_0666121 [Tanacetum coccineum]